MGWVRKNTPVTMRTGYYYLDNEIALHAHIGAPLKQPRHKSTFWPEKNRIEAACLWAATRDIEKVHQLTTIPRHCIRKWMLEPWWDHIVSNVRKEQNELLDLKLTEVIGTAVDVIKDRLTHGEIHVDRKTQEEYRVPANIRSASSALEVTFKERQLIRGEATTRTESVTQDEKLKTLKDQFERLAQSKHINPNVEVIEHEPVQGTGEGETAGPDPQDWAEESSEDGTSEGPGIEEEINALDSEAKQTFSRG
jgi:hypothetical protein